MSALGDRDPRAARRAGLPALLAMTDLQEAGGEAALLLRAERLQAAAPGRIAFLLRDLELPAQGREALGRGLAARVERLCVHSSVGLARELGAWGLHLPEGADLAAARRAWDGALGCSRHSVAGLADAAEKHADYALLSPVRAVPGKAPARGWRDFDDAPLPTYALGGLELGDAAAARAAGAWGLAGIRCFWTGPLDGLAAAAEALNRSDRR